MKIGFIRKLLAASRQNRSRAADLSEPMRRVDQARLVLEGHDSAVLSVIVMPDGRTVVSGSLNNRIKVWDLRTGQCRVTRIHGHSGGIPGMAATLDGKKFISCSTDRRLKIWDLETADVVQTLEEAAGKPGGVAMSDDGRTVVSASSDNKLAVWDLETRHPTRGFGDHSTDAHGVDVSRDGKVAVFGSMGQTVKVWDLEGNRCLNVLKGHNEFVSSVAVSSDIKTVVSGSYDYTLRVWDLETSQCRATLEGHTDNINRVVITPDGKRILSASKDKTVKMWDLPTGRCIMTFEGHSAAVNDLAVTFDNKIFISASSDGTLRVWHLPVTDVIVNFANAVNYINAKVVLVGESGAGKTGLALRLAEDRWQETESTHGMNVWPLKLPDLETANMEREVWLWDFAGQPDYRLIHQLYMDETALALLIVDPQADNPFQPLEHWEKALKVAVKYDPAKMLIGARCDRGGFTISQRKIDQHCATHGYLAHLNTSAKTAEGCEDLKTLISENIPWDRLPWTATTHLFKTLKDAILAVKEEGMTLVRISELRQRLQLQLQDGSIEERTLRAVVRLLGSQGIVKKLDFGDFVLLKPEQINNYASAVVRNARENVDEIGAVSERDVLEAQIDFKDMNRLDETDEKILLRAMLQTFFDRALCARVDTEKGTQLVFPSYFKQDRPEAPEIPPVIINYGFSGTLDDIYSTLVVRLHYTETFEMDELWRYAADFKTPADKRVGLQMTKKRDTDAEIQVYFDADVPIDTKVTFIKYIHEHLKKYAQAVIRVRSYVCPFCDEPLENRRAIKIRLEKGFSDVLCSACEGRVPLHDLIETKFASDEFLQTVQEMDKRAKINLDNESLELILVGHAFTTVAEAGHIFRPTPNSDWGIDGEIEFKNPRGEASGQRLYLQLKSGDSYLRKRKYDDAEIFTIKKRRQAEYWLSQAYPVMLVIRTSDDQIRWMNITEYLVRHGVGSKQIVFEGEAFNAGNVAIMRNRMLGGK